VPQFLQTAAHRISFIVCGPEAIDRQVESLTQSIRHALADGSAQEPDQYCNKNGFGDVGNWRLAKRQQLGGDFRLGRHVDLISGGR
jgi:hypothetical protein